MQGLIRKRSYTTKSGKEAVNWYVVVDLALTRTTIESGSGTAAQKRAERRKLLAPRSSVAFTMAHPHLRPEALRLHRNEQQVDRQEWGTARIDPDLVSCKENRFIAKPSNGSLRRASCPPSDFNDLMHTHATIPFRAGIRPKLFCERLGHENPAFALKQYAHVIPGMQAEQHGL